jgi:hypothetical protein
MNRYFSGLCGVMLLSLSVAAQPTKSADKGIAQPEIFQPYRLDLTVSLNPAPVPLLQLTLLPSGRDRIPGNAALGYYRAINLQPAWPRDPEASRKLAEQLIKWEETPNERFPAREVAEYLKQHRHMFRAVDEAARMASIDWQARQDRADEVGASVESIQGFRELARYLKLRFRVELVENRLADAFRTMQTSLQLGKHLAEGSNLIQMLVGLAIVRISLDELQQYLQHPSAPNLYWALATLPKPLVDPRFALDGESRLSLSFIPSLKSLEAGPVSEPEATRALQDTFKMMSGIFDQEGSPSGMNPFFNVLGANTMATSLAPQARKDLIAFGWSPKNVENMPAAQVVLLRGVAQHRKLWDEQVTKFYLPYPIATQEFKAFPQKLEAMKKQNPKDTLFTVYSLLYPALMKGYEAHARGERTVAELQTLEAIRLHAATNAGKFPANLSEVTTVPVPMDPFYLKPFNYTPTETGFVLTALPPAGEKANLGNSREYTVKLRK